LEIQKARGRIREVVARILALVIRLSVVVCILAFTGSQGMCGDNGCHIPEYSNLGVFLDNHNLFLTDEGTSHNGKSLINEIEHIENFDIQHGLQVKKKSRWMAVGIAAVPGFVFHGLGHFYAEDYLMGGVLAWTEFISIPMIIEGYLEDQRNRTSQYPADDSSPAYMFGIAIFSISWFVDIYRSPIAVSKYNMRDTRSYYIQPKFDSHLVSVTVIYTF
jgi:hypothetical protein